MSILLPSPSGYHACMYMPSIYIYPGTIVSRDSTQSCRYVRFACRCVQYVGMFVLCTTWYLCCTLRPPCIIRNHHPHHICCFGVYSKSSTYTGIYIYSVTSFLAAPWKKPFEKKGTNKTPTLDLGGRRFPPGRRSSRNHIASRIFPCIISLCRRTHRNCSAVKDVKRCLGNRWVKQT